MDIQIPTEQQTIIEGLVSSGRFANAEEAIAEGLRLLVSSERLRSEIQVGIDQADRGEVYDHDTVFSQLRAMAAEVSSR